MPDSKQPTPTAPASPSDEDKPKAAPKASLVPAAESGDPDVHRLLAERQAAQSNLDDLTPSEDDKAKAKAAREQMADVDKRLAELGVTAQ